MSTTNNDTKQPSMAKAWAFAFFLAIIAGGIYAFMKYMPDNTSYVNTMNADDAAEDSVRQASEAFMEKIEKDPEVKPLGGGVFYKELQAGSGAKPTDSSKVRVNYEGRLIDGKIFDSSYERGQAASFPLNGVIQGWQIALKAMPVGSTWEVYIPQYYGYGAAGTDNIPPYSALVFKVELLGIE